MIKIYNKLLKSVLGVHSYMDKLHVIRKEVVIWKPKYCHTVSNILINVRHHVYRSNNCTDNRTTYFWRKVKIKKYLNYPVVIYFDGIFIISFKVTVFCNPIVEIKKIYVLIHLTTNNSKDMRRVWNALYSILTIVNLAHLGSKITWSISWELLALRGSFLNNVLKTHFWCGHSARESAGVQKPHTFTPLKAIRKKEKTLSGF